jgi:O-antigen ligase
LVLTAIFVVHAVFFARLYFRRGRRAFDLLFVGGFVLLAAFYATSASLFLVGVEPLPTHLSLLRWAGLILCTLATPPFLVHWVRRRRGEPVRP